MCHKVPLSPVPVCSIHHRSSQSFERSGLGELDAGRRVPLLMHADDIVLARTEAELQAMLDVVTVYARHWRFKLNYKKSNLVVMGTRGFMCLAAWSAA